MYFSSADGIYTHQINPTDLSSVHTTPHDCVHKKHFILRPSRPGIYLHLEIVHGGLLVDVTQAVESTGEGG